MKKIIITAIIICCSHSLFAQGQRWEVFIGLPNRDYYVKDLIEYYDKGYYLEGSFFPIGQDGKGWNSKTSINGLVLWENTVIHSNGKYRGYSVVLDSIGNRYVGGVFFGLEGTDPYWPFITKFNACGEKEWCKILIEPQYSSGFAADMLINSNNELIVLVRSKDQNFDNDVRLVGFDLDGNLLWSQSYLDLETYWWLYNAVIYSMTKHNNEYYLTGYCYWPNPNNPNVASLRAFFIGIDSLFNEKWFLPFNASGEIRGNSFSITAINDTLIMGVGDQWLPGIEKQSLLMFLNTDGLELGYQHISNSAIGPLYNLNVIETATRLNDSTFLSPVYLGIYPYTYFGEIIYDTAGHVFSYQNRGDKAGNSRMTKSSNEKFVIAIPRKVNSSYNSIYMYQIDDNLQSIPFDTTTYNYDSLCPNPINSGVIDMSDCMVWVGTESIPTPKEYYSRMSAIPITIFPNPAKDHITFALENTVHHRNIELRCFNLLGLQQHQTTILRGQQQATANVNAWPPGMYVVVVYSDGRPVGRRKFVVH